MAVAARDRLEDFGGLSGLVVLDKIADVDEPLVAGEALGSFAAGSGCGILDSVHMSSFRLWAGLRGVSAPAGPFLYPTYVFYYKCLQVSTNMVE